MSSPAGDLLELIERLEALLDGDERSRIVDRVTSADDPAVWLDRLRAQMSAHVLRHAAGAVDVAGLVRRLDQRTRTDGFRVLHAWNHQTHQFTDDVVPVLMLDFLVRVGVPEIDRVRVAILLDYYLLHLLALCAMRVWDVDDPSGTLDRLTGLVERLQGPGGSGHHFVEDAETLLIYALSQFHPEEHAYDRVIDRVATLSAVHQLKFAVVSAAVLGAHLRWGFWIMYGRDVVKMRRDNVGDYPWLLYAVLTLTRAFVRSLEAGESREVRAPTVQALLQGLAADPWAFTGSPPPALHDYRDEYDELMGLLRKHADDLLAELAAQEPAKTRYAPLALHFNFPHNTLVAIVTLALLEGRPQSLALNALFRPEFDTGHEETQEGLARALMAFSRGSPDRLGYRGAMLVAYDPLSGLRSFSMTTGTLRKGLSG